MKIYLKLIIFFVAISITTVAKSQQLVSLEYEKVMYDWNVNDFIVFSKTFTFDSVFIDKFHIKIRSKKIDLTKQRELSKWGNKTGITTIYQTVTDENKIVTAWVIETKEGISKVVIMDSPNSDYGTAYKLVRLPSSKNK